MRNSTIYQGKGGGMLTTPHTNTSIEGFRQAFQRVGQHATRLTKRHRAAGTAGNTPITSVCTRPPGTYTSKRGVMPNALATRSLQKSEIS